ncbi:MAG TPA: ABC transporter permease subunit [Verrucomicrobiae bacterium]|nr:ABC transporter permease subunit [Verrucomicrobiae bacterium]
MSGPRSLRAGAIVLIALFTVAPMLATLLYSLATVWRRRPLPDGYTLQWWAATLSDQAFLAAAGRSLLLALATVLLINLLVLPPLYWSHVRNPRIRPVLQLAALIPFVLPGIVMAAAINRFVGLWPLTAGLQATSTLLLLSSVAVSFSAYLWAVDGAMRSARIASLCEAASTLGATPLYMLRRVVVPNIKHGIAIGSLLAFAGVIGELALPRIITGSSFETIPLWQLRKMRGTDADPNAVAVSSLLLLALLFVFSVLVIRRSRGGIAGIIPTLEKD